VPAAGEEAFASTALNFQTGRYERRDVKLVRNAATGVDQLRSRDSEHVAPPPAAAAAWQEQAGSGRIVHPTLRVSQNDQFAVPADGGHQKIAYISQAGIDAANAAMLAEPAPGRLRIQPGNLALTVNGTVLLQATITRPAAEDVDPSRITQAVTEATVWLPTMLESVCHKFAQGVFPHLPELGAGTPPAGPGAAAAPGVGQKYFMSSDGPDPSPQSPKQFGRTAAALGDFDAALAQVDLDNDLYDVLAGVGGPAWTDAMRSMVPGWRDHSEAVIGADPPDTLSIANYNRLAEFGYITALRFRELWRVNRVFRRDLMAILGQKTISPVDLSARLSSGPAARDFLELVRRSRDDAVVAVADALLALNESRRLLQAQLWYFDMYGPANQSFQARYQVLGGRGGAATTTVEG